MSKKLGYIEIPRAEFTSTTYEWRNYIDTDDSNNADATACETACTAKDKECNFFIWARVSGSTKCYFGKFARDAKTTNNLVGLATGADIQRGITTDGVVKLKKGLL